MAPTSVLSPGFAFEWAFAYFLYARYALRFLWLRTFDLHFHVFHLFILQGTFQPIHVEMCQYEKHMCVIMLVSPLIWRSNMVNKDRQQDPLSLPFTRPEQKLRHWLLITSWYNVDYISKVPYL